MKDDNLADLPRLVYEQSLLISDLWGDMTRIKFRLLAQDAAVSALISVTVDLDRLNDLYMDAMDRVADQAEGAHLEHAREEYQRLSAAITKESVRRRVSRSPYGE